MPFRPFAGIQTIVATPQPVFGTAMNGAGVVATDPYTRNTKPGSNLSQTVLPVTTTLGFTKNDRVLVGPVGGPYDQGSIFSIVPNVSITVEGLLVSHASGEVVILNEDVAQVTIIPVVGNAGVFYLGTDSTVSITSTSLFDMVPPPVAAAQPTYWHNPPGIGGGGGYKTSEYWIRGTIGDKFLARISVL